MPIETVPEINLDKFTEGAALTEQLSRVEEKEQNLVFLHSSVEGFEKIVTTLMALRARNVSAILFLKKSERTLEDNELSALFNYLRDWDQLFLSNFLEFCGDWVPQDFQNALRNEAKIELKWAQEWLTATTDQRIYKYPGLPWRSFIRKIVGENYNFVTRFLELTALPGTPENLEAMTTHLKVFLEAKKKVVCIFPKKWGNKLEN